MLVNPLGEGFQMGTHPVDGPVRPLPGTVFGVWAVMERLCKALHNRSVGLQTPCCRERAKQGEALGTDDVIKPVRRGKTSIISTSLQKINIASPGFACSRH